MRTNEELLAEIEARTKENQKYTQLMIEEDDLESVALMAQLIILNNLHIKTNHLMIRANNLKL